MDHFDVYVLRFDVSEERAARAMMHVFGLTEASARVFVHSVPRIGKRDVPSAMAERYVRALHAVGAVVECRRSGTAPLGESANRAQHMSLPAPADEAINAVTNPPHIMQDSLGIMAPLAYSPEMPQIPKAPRVPADLHHLRARKGPDSLAPNWRPARPGRSAASHSSGSSGHLRAISSDPAAWGDSADSLANSRDPLSELSDASEELGPNRRSPRRFGRRSPAAQSRGGNDNDDSESEPPQSGPPMGSSDRPGHSQDSGPWYSSAMHQLIVAALIIGAMGFALSAGVFQSADTQMTSALREAGLEPGTFEIATSFAAEPGNRFESLSAEQLRALTEVLRNSGAREIWVAGIQRAETQRTSRTLLIELPDDPGARRAVFEELASARRSGAVGVPDTGQRYVRVEF